MPFTPFHLGPAFLLGEIFEKKISLISILLGSTVVDLRATYCLFAGCRPLHGPLHTFLGATTVAFLLSLLLFSQRKWLQRITDKLKIEQKYSFMSLLAGSLIGTWSHVFLDSFLYTDIRPLWPLPNNPLLGLVSSGAIYLICLLSFLPATGIYCYKYLKRH
ncbi:metal-dependent hydrolase [Methanolobus sp. ZRKC4]|uniref:metal-dependent hydrolase n=1 Tax=Methanolobus sp. ZRKC4 TaxID=3125787 RepID=UPI0032503FFC